MGVTGGSQTGVVLGEGQAVQAGVQWSDEAGADSGCGEVFDAVPIPLSLGLWGALWSHFTQSFHGACVCVCLCV